MKNFKIEDLFGPIAAGWLGGMGIIGGLGKTDTWATIGGIAGATFMLYQHFQRKKKESERHQDVK